MKMKHDDKKFICVLCQKEKQGYGNNAEPLAKGKCCDECNVKVIKKRLRRVEKQKEPAYRKRKPDLETESIRAWVSNEKEFKDAEKIAKDETHKIEIKFDNGFMMRLMGFTKMINKETDKILFAYKFKKENKTIMYYIPENQTKETKEKMKIFLNKLTAMAEVSGYEMVDGREFAKTSADEAGRLRKVHPKMQKN